jgi:hypothetical protein
VDWSTSVSSSSRLRAFVWWWQFIAFLVESDGKIGESLGSRELRALLLGDGVSATESFENSL